MLTACCLLYVAVLCVVRRPVCALLLQVLAMGELIKAGKIKAWGVSNETTYGKAPQDSLLARASTARGPSSLGIRVPLSPPARACVGTAALGDTRLRWPPEVDGCCDAGRSFAVAVCRCLPAV